MLKKTIAISASLILASEGNTIGTQQITNILYTGDNPSSVSITGSDGVNKLYTIVYDGDNVSEIRVT